MQLLRYVYKTTLNVKDGNLIKEGLKHDHRFTQHLKAMQRLGLQEPKCLSVKGILQQKSFIKS